MENTDVYELTNPQKSIWLTEQYYKGTNINTICGTIFFKENVDVNLLKETVKTFINLNDSMRIKIVVNNGFPQQFISDGKISEIEVFNLNNVNELHELEDKIAKTSFNIIDSDLYSFKVFKLKDGTGGIIGHLHHLISDAWSFGLMSKQLKDIYQKLLLKQTNFEPSPSYLQYILKEKDYLLSEKYINDKEYWENSFSNIPDLATLKPYFNKEIKTTSKRYTAKLDYDLCEKINEYSKKYNSSAYSFFMSVYSIYLAVVSGIDNVVIGTPFLNRSNFKDKNTMGMFVNTLPNKLNIDWNITFSEYLKYTTTEQKNMFRHSKYPYDKLLEKIRKEQDLNRNIYDIAISYQNARNDSQESSINYFTYWNYCGNIAESMEIHVFDMDNTGSLQLFYDYQTAKFSENEVEKIHHRILTIINQVLNNDILLKNIEIVTPEEKQQLLVDFNNTKTEYPRDKTIAQVFEDQAKLKPNKPAIVFENEIITYKQFNEKANKLAHFLQDKGVQAHDKVVILAEKSIDLYVSIMAILKIGALYVPVDIEYPEERIKLIIEDCKPKCVIIDKKHTNLINYENKCTLPLQNIEKYSSKNVECKIKSEDGAYIIYTSGSTGKPKGVVVPNRGVVRLVKNTNYIEFKENDRILQNIAVVFDASTFAIFGSFLNGLTLYPINKEKLLDFPYLEKFIKENDINIINSTVSFFNKLIEYNPKFFDKTRAVLIGGEQVLPKTVNIFRKNNPNAEIVNVYGPTENSNLSCCHIIKKEYTKSIPIGIPVSNSTCYVLSKNQQLLPVGIHGELYVGGDGVATEYLNNKKLTNEKFIPNIFGEGKLYKTGDLCYLEKDGIIQFISRIDKQVKIRGYRIELKEIETKILEYGNIKECAVVVSEKNDNKFLVAYIVPKNEIDTINLNKYLRDNLPNYMVPSKIMCLDNLPLNVNGKLDTKALPNADLDDNDRNIVEPRNEVEQAITNVLEQVLNTSNISVLDSIFDLGADSLSAISISNMLSQKFKVTITVKDLFNNHIIEDLANYISNQSHNTEKTIKLAKKMKYYPASNAQKRIYYSYMADNNSILYNTAGGIILDNYLDTAKLEDCFKQLIKRHDSLRTYFDIIDNELVQIIGDDINFVLDTEKSTENNVNEIYKEFVKPFDLAKAPLFRIKTVKLKNKKMMLLIDMHHIITDGFSIGILLQELCDLYNNKSLTKKVIDYKDFSMWEKEQEQTTEFKKAKNYWVNQYKDEIPLLNMPTSFARPSVQNFEGSNFYAKLDNALFTRINETAKSLEITPYMLMLSCYYILLSKYTSQNDIVVGTPTAGRDFSELNNIVGMFVNTLPLRNIVDHSLKFHKFANNIKNYCLKAFEYQNYPFNDLVKDLNIKRDISRNPLFDTMFIYQNNGYPKLTFENNNVEYFIPNSNKSKFDLSLEVVPNNNEYKLRFEYCTKLFNKEFIERMSSHYINILNSVLNNTDIKISEIDMLSDDERNKILYEFNNTKSLYDDSLSYVDLFEKQVKKTPNKVAIVFHNQTITYKELNDKSNQIANFLISKGVNNNEFVGLLVNRSIEMIIAMLGILKSGAAYLPMDPTFPINRIKYMINDSKVKIILSQNEIIQKFNLSKAYPIDLDNSSIYHDFDKENLNLYLLTTNYAYLIYTSGSTGNPKGVIISHKNINNFINGFSKKLSFIENKNIISTTTVCFDIFGLETLLPLQKGLTIILADEEEQTVPSKLNILCQKHNVNIIQSTPSKFNLFLTDETELDFLKKIDTVILGGEPLPENLLYKLKTLTDASIYNVYGPTETTIWSSIKDMTHSDKITIGKPISNTQMYILDEEKNILPVGIPGELYIAGEGLSTGYYNKADLTKERFLKNPFNKNTLMYRTGDLAKWLPSGEIEYIGRTDFQIKLHGLRIELGEIENAILKFKNIDSCIVTVKNNSLNRQVLCAYVISKKQLLEENIKDFLKKILPTYMIPSYIMQIDNYKYTPNGKIDRNALPIPNDFYNSLNNSNTASLSDNTNYVKPTSQLEIKIASIFEKLLSKSPIGIDDNFFELGGDSLLAINLQINLLKENLNITYSDIFMYPTIRELSKRIVSNDTNAYTNLDNENIDFNDILSNTCTLPNELQYKNVGNILLSGCTGFLGAHVLDQFLKNEKGIVYCLIRPQQGLTLQNKLENKLHYYFGRKYDKYIGNRIIIINSDITKNQLGLSEKELIDLSNNISCVINCAAKVSHYGDYNIYKNVNVTGTENLLKFCDTFKKRFYQISTISVSGNSLADQSYISQNFEQEVEFKEDNFYINQSLDNVYVRSKFEAEKLVLQYCQKGLDAYIIRVGNLMNRFEDGKFQPNVKKNAFINRLVSFSKIGCIPDYLINGYMEFTPVDSCAESIIKLIQYPSSNNRIFHVYNYNHVNIINFINVIKKYISVDVLNNDNFIEKINYLLSQENSDQILAGILRDFDINKKLIYDSPIKIKSDFSVKYLKQTGFVWPKIDKDYLTKFIEYFIKLGYIKKENN